MVFEEKQLGRARNALLPFLEHRLYIPKIYFEADWNGQRLDVLAIDRDGSGDVHAVLLFAQEPLADSEASLVRRTQTESELLERFAEIPAQYKYIACAVSTTEASELKRSPAFIESLLAPDGMGRVGLLTVSGLKDEEEPRVTLEVKPERFRAKIAQLADDYVEKHTADWEIRA